MKLEYGVEDGSFRTAGGEDGIRKLVDDFYDAMESDPAATTIRRMHPEDLAIARDKLARFLCGWLGGPKRYSEKYGPIQIPRAHKRFPIGEAERDAWLHCMADAISQQDYPLDFATYLLKELRVPAQRIVDVGRRPDD